MLSFKKNIHWFCFLCSFALLAACKKDEVNYNKEDLTNPVSFFPAPPSEWISFNGNTYYSSGYVADAMPYFEGDSFHVFYLHDGDGNGGYHPIHEFTTADLVHYDYKGKMIAYGADADQDRALGTGSVVKAGNTYYFYYTGHNDLHWNTGEPVEGVMYATSTDLKNWTKKTGFVIYPSTGYGPNDFRDPYVVYNDATSEYWMLVATKNNNQPVIALYTTTDPATDNWTLKDPLYTTDNNAYGVMECPDLFKMGNNWYLIFSENGVNRTTHYRMATSANGPWTTPAVDVLDGAFFYAGKTASNGTNRYLFGWTYRKDGATDYGGNIFGGNLVTHQLIQNADGTLSTKTPDAISSLFTKNISLNQDSTHTSSVTGNSYTLQDGGFTGFDLISGQKKITTTLKSLQTNGDAGFVFGYARPGNSDYYKLRLKNGMAYTLKVQGTSEYIDAQVPFSFTPGSNVNVEIVINNSVLVVTIDGKTTLTSRSYWLPNAKWGIYAAGGSVTFNDLKLQDY